MSNCDEIIIDVDDMLNDIFYPPEIENENPSPQIKSPYKFGYSGYFSSNARSNLVDSSKESEVNKTNVKEKQKKIDKPAKWDVKYKNFDETLFSIIWHVPVTQRLYSILLHNKD